VLWGLLCGRGRGARNSCGNDSFDYRYRSGKSACLGRARRGHTGTQGRHACRRVVTYLHPTIQGQQGLTREERVAGRFVYSRSFDTQAADRSKRIEVSLHAAAKAQAAQTFKQPTPGGNGGNPDRLAPRPDKSLKEKE
jgi:hypothetical protein